MTRPLMPMATAVWLVENTALTFRQIARFCVLHVLEIQAIADETVGQTMVGQDPTLTGQLTWEEINRCSKDPAAELQIIEDEVPTQLRTKGPRYTPVSKRQDKPSAIAWLIRHHSELTDAQIGRLIGTTKPTIEAIRERTHWNIQNIQPSDPVSLGLCSQQELDDAVHKAHLKAEKAAKYAKEIVAEQQEKKSKSAAKEVAEEAAAKEVAEEAAAEEAAKEAAKEAAEAVAEEAAVEADEADAGEAATDEADEADEAGEADAGEAATDEADEADEATGEAATDDTGEADTDDTGEADTVEADSGDTDDTADKADKAATSDEAQA